MARMEAVAENLQQILGHVNNFSANVVHKIAEATKQKQLLQGRLEKLEGAQKFLKNHIEKGMKNATR